MKKSLLLQVVMMLLVSAFAKAQSEQLARNYADQGEYQKAIISYKKALVKQRGNSVLLAGLIKSYQQLEQYNKAEEVISQNLKTTRDKGFLLVELGYNHQLQEPCVLMRWVWRVTLIQILIYS